MFIVLSSTYRRALRKIKSLEIDLAYANSKVRHYQRRTNTAIDERNAFVDMINKRGGQRFLDGEVNQFSAKEINMLISLCHPDKHDGKESANIITTKLLKLRK